LILIASIMQSLLFRGKKK